MTPQANNAELRPQTVICKDCQETFTVTVDLQKRLISIFGKRWHMPARCYPCREARRSERGE